MRTFKLIGIGLLAAASGCGLLDTTKTSADLTDYIDLVAAGTTTGVLVDGTPAAGSGPTLNVVTGGATIPGGSKVMDVTSTTSFNSLVVMVEGVAGYYEIRNLASSTTASLVITFGQKAPDVFTLNLAAGNSGGYGARSSVPITMTSVGTGTIQINVSWDVDSDVDLHVVDPSGAEIYYGNRYSASGGELDLDSNADCSIDHQRSENITWAGTAPRGTYTIRVDYFLACGVSATKYVVTANAAGQSPKVWRGTFTGGGDVGGAGSGTTIGTITY